MPPHRNVHVLIPRNCEYVNLTWQEGIKIAEEIKAANQPTLRWGDYPALFTWAQSNHEGP